MYYGILRIEPLTRAVLPLIAAHACDAIVAFDTCRIRVTIVIIQVFHEVFIVFLSENSSFVPCVMPALSAERVGPTGTVHFRSVAVTLHFVSNIHVSLIRCLILITAYVFVTGFF